MTEAPVSPPPAPPAPGAPPPRRPGIVTVGMDATTFLWGTMLAVGMMYAVNAFELEQIRRVTPAGRRCLTLTAQLRIDIREARRVLHRFQEEVEGW